MNKVIGDIHGKDVWKKYIDSEFDHFYFIGDYFDNYEETPTVTQIRNFREICEHARKNPNIHLCLGNHDFHYLKGISEQYSGYQFYTHFDIQEALEENIDLLKPVYQNGDYLISHAGITKTFLYDVLKLKNPLDINTRFEENRTCLEFNGINRYGDDITQSCIWVRPISLRKDKLDNYKQIVGHTRVDYIETFNDITFTDCLDSDHSILCF
jgi:predicted MPP superfamily phosphohydrolase